MTLWTISNRAGEFLCLLFLEALVMGTAIVTLLLGGIIRFNCPLVTSSKYKNKMLEKVQRIPELIPDKETKEREMLQVVSLHWRISALGSPCYFRYRMSSPHSEQY